MTQALPMVPAPDRSLLFLAAIAALLAGVLALLAYVAYSARYTRFEVSGEGLRPLYVTDPDRVVCIPTTDGYALMLSVVRPEGMLAALRGL